jgi:diguanylate cyclase (GGDEF)-like protein
MLPNTPPEGVEKVAEKLRESVESLQINNEDSLCGSVVTISLGVAAAPRGDVVFETLLKKADEALYAAKQNGRNRVETITVTPQ